MKLEDLNGVLMGLSPLKSSEFISVFEACGRAMAADLICQKQLPAFDNSALDGYAFNYDDIDAPLFIKGTILAGDKTLYKIGKNECYKIMTGAPFPVGSDTVLMVEEEAFDESGRLIITSDSAKKLKRGNAKKLAGEEANLGDILLKKGDLITPAAAMMLASQGVSFVEVITKPKIALFSSGDEVCEPWQTAELMGIYNANAAGLMALLSQNGLNAHYKGILKDDPALIKEALTAHQNYDIIATSGGASRGDADFMRQTLLNLGYKELFNSIEIRPAKPTKMFVKDAQLVVILPGNPMSCALAAALSLIPAIKRLSGLNEWQNRLISVPLNGDLKLKASRANIIIGHFDGTHFTPTNSNIYSPSQIRPLLSSNAIAAMPAGISELKNDEILQILQIF